MRALWLLQTAARALLLMLCGLLCTPAGAQPLATAPPCQVDASRDTFNLGHCLSELARGPEGDRVMRLALEVDTAQPRILALGLPDAFRLQVRQVGVEAPLLALDTQSPQQLRPLPHRQLALPLALQPGLNEFELRYRLHGDGKLNPQLLSAPAFARHSVQADLFNGFAAGVLVMLCAIVLIHHWTGGPSSNLAYTGLVASEIAVVAQVEGYTFAALWPHAPTWNNLAPPMMCLVVLLAHATFSVRFLELRARYPGLWRLTCGWVLAVVAGAVGLLSTLLAGPDQALDRLLAVERWMGVLVVAYVVIAAVASWRAVRDHLPGARPYALGMLSLAIFSFVLFPLAIFGWGLLPGVELVLYPKLGLLVEAAWFSAALVLRVRRFQDERIQARTQRLAEAEDLLRAETAKRAALEQARAQSLHLASASHDISQPLASLRFAIAALRQREAAGSPAEIGAHLERSLSYAETLLRDIIEQARNELPEREDHIELGSFFHQLCCAWLDQASARGLRLGYADTVLELDASALILSRLLNNLLSNALRYTARGRVLLGARRRPGGIELQVLDTGPGLLPEQVERLSRPFERGHVDSEGFGLGLFIVRSLCAQCGYELRVRSVLGRGTCFGIWIPTP